MMNETLLYIAEAISEDYCMDIEQAINIVNNSFFPEALKRHPEFVEHYDADYWIQEIMKHSVVR